MIRGGVVVGLQLITAHRQECLCHWRRCERGDVAGWELVVKKSKEPAGRRRYGSECLA